MSKNSRTIQEMEIGSMETEIRKVLAILEAKQLQKTLVYEDVWPLEALRRDYEAAVDRLEAEDELARLRYLDQQGRAGKRVRRAFEGESKRLREELAAAGRKSSPDAERILAKLEAVDNELLHRDPNTEEEQAILDRNSGRRALINEIELCRAIHRWRDLILAEQLIWNRLVGAKTR